VSPVKELHRKAMEQADLGHTARRDGQAETAQVHFQEAYRFERDAAEQLRNRIDTEPSRSILFRSAATLAIEAGHLIEAEQMVCMALAGQPPTEIAEELRDLFEQINFRRHLSLRGVKLADRELQMSIAGPSIGYGIAPTDAVIERIEHTQALVYRFTERKLRKPYRKGTVSKEVREAVSLFMAVPRAASYAVSLMVGGVQETLPGMSIGESVIDDVVECLDLFVRDEEDALRERIPEEEYLTNFKGLAKAIAPDGEEIQTVGFTALRDGEEKSVALRPVRRLDSAAPTPAIDPKKSQEKISVTVTGTLLFADAMEHKQNLIKLVDENGVKHSIVVPPGMMDDIVHPLWDSRVTVTGPLKRGRILLADILRARE
jgi:hypothetical protein